MSGEHPNATAYRRTAGAGSTPAISTAIWHVPGAHPMAGDVRGHDALLAWLAKVGTLGFRLSEHDAFGNDEHVCTLSIMGARRGDLDVETRVVSIFHYRDGQQLERWFYPDDPAVWEQIFTE